MEISHIIGRLKVEHRISRGRNKETGVNCLHELLCAAGKNTLRLLSLIERNEVKLLHAFFLRLQKAVASGEIPKELIEKLKSISIMLSTNLRCRVFMVIR